MFDFMKLFERESIDISSLATDLESNLDFDLSKKQHGEKIVALASQIRNIAVTTHIHENEKIKILTLLNKAKLRALSHDNMDTYRVFLALDSITADLIKI